MTKMRRVLVFFLSVCSLFSNPSDDLPLNWNDPKWAWMDEGIRLDFLYFEPKKPIDLKTASKKQIRMHNRKRRGITEQMLDAVMYTRGKISFGYALDRFQVIGREVYGPEGESKRLLQKVAKLYPVPDVDVIIHGQDIIFNHWELKGPVLVTCKTGVGQQIFFPVQLWETWVQFAKQIDDLSEKIEWDKKVPKYFWRGKPNDADNYNDRTMWTKWRRGKFCYLSTQYPELMDVAFSGHRDSNTIRDDLVEEFYKIFPKKPATWEEYIGYKYLPELDGYVAGTPGYVWKLLSNCAVFKHDSPYQLWFYGQLSPWVHYIPFKEDLSDIFEKLQWAKEHEEEVKQIAENGRQFAKENLMPEHLYLYCYKVLVKYASLQRFTPKVQL